MSATSIVYDPGYDFHLLGLERLHPFDSRKFSRAWRSATAAHAEIEGLRVDPGPVAELDWTLVHDAAYLASLRSSKTIAAAIEIGLARLLPQAVLDRGILAPMRLMGSGTVTACRQALQGRWSINLGGGFHHAHRTHGEGFCCYADIPLAIAQARRDGLLAADDPIWYIDLDAHRGNGFEAIFEEDPRVQVLDVYNFQAYPGRRSPDERFPHLISVRARLDGDGYLAVVRDGLERFIAEAPRPRLAFFVAGSDILTGDPLGGLDVAFDQVLERDRLVLQRLSDLGIPWVMTTGGGYTASSAELIARTIAWAAQHLL